MFKKKAKNIMVQGTMSDAGKSILVTALCRIFKQDGLSVTPFKAQNMALNSYITLDGLEMGRAQVAQAEAAGKEPDARMNPILLKPSSDTGSQLIVVGKVRDEVTATSYYERKEELVPEIMEAYRSLEESSDIMVIEGAGSPAEINLRDVDIVNMGFAKMVDAPVLLAGDIDRGGVFAQLYGTVGLMEDDERERIEGFIVNKFRGDVDILKPGLTELENLTGIPVLGVVPFIDVDIDDEDSLSARLSGGKGPAGASGGASGERPIDIAVIRLPRLSNFTDFSPLELCPDLGVRYVRKKDELGTPDMVVIPGTKSTIDDLIWLREKGIEQKIKELAAAGTPVLGVCGGYQMLGEKLNDPDHLESKTGSIEGIGLLPTETTYTPGKRRTRYKAEVTSSLFKGTHIDGYEIHMGETRLSGDAGTEPSGSNGSKAADPGSSASCENFVKLENGEADGFVKGNVFGTYLHGLFDTGELTKRVADMLLERKGLAPSDYTPVDHNKYKDEQYDKLADGIREVLDIEKIYEIIEKYK